MANEERIRQFVELCVALVADRDSEAAAAALVGKDDGETAEQLKDDLISAIDDYDADALEEEEGDSADEEEEEEEE